MGTKDENVRIDRLWPDPAEDLSPAQLLEHYAFPERQGEAHDWLRVNFVTSLDGAVTRGGVSGPLGTAGDEAVFELLRRQADVLLLGAGTARKEGYGAMVLDDDAVAWRRDRGMPEQPVFALVSGRLDLDPDSPIFTEAPVRPVVYTHRGGTSGAGADGGGLHAERRAALSEVADVVDVGETGLEVGLLRADLRARRLHRVHCEGGPTLFAALLAAGAVDELCLTAAPTVESGLAGRITRGTSAVPTEMELNGVLRCGNELLLRYRTRRA